MIDTNDKGFCSECGKEVNVNDVAAHVQEYHPFATGFAAIIMARCQLCGFVCPKGVMLEHMQRIHHAPKSQFYPRGTDG